MSAAAVAVTPPEAAHKFGNRVVPAIGNARASKNTVVQSMMLLLTYNI
jgi:hypothetical protein